MNLAGRAMDLAGRAMNLAGRAMNLAGRAMSLAGRAMGLAGRAMLGPLTFFVIITALILPTLLVAAERRKVPWCLTRRRLSR